MKIGILGDLHITDRRPRSRTDEEYLQTLFSKLDFALSSCFRECQILLIPGDLFDSFRAPHFVIRGTIKLFSRFGIVALVVFGQHDMRFHSSERENTPLGILEGAEVVFLLGPEPFKMEKIDIYGANWGEDIPAIADHDRFNILVIHKMIVKDGPLWEGQTGYSMAKTMLRKEEFDLIVSGDNHQFFTETVGNRQLVNLGSLMRSTIAQMEHIPHCAVFDTEKRQLELFEIPINSDVFDLEAREEEREKEANMERLEAFIEGLSNTSNIEGLDFRKNMQLWMEINREEINEGTRKAIEEVLNWIK